MKNLFTALAITIASATSVHAEEVTASEQLVSCLQSALVTYIADSTGNSNLDTLVAIGSEPLKTQVTEILMHQVVTTALYKAEGFHPNEVLEVFGTTKPLYDAQLTVCVYEYFYS